MDSAQEFVKVLKNTADPPTVNGLLKIELSRHVWDTPTFHLPRKAQVIAEWLLLKYTKDKDTERYAN